MSKAGDNRPEFPIYMQEAVIAQVVVHIGHQNREGDAPPQAEPRDQIAERVPLIIQTKRQLQESPGGDRARNASGARSKPTNSELTHWFASFTVSMRKIASDDMDDTTQAPIRWFHLTPGRFVIALLAVEAILWLSESLGWPVWHKGYAVLTGLAVVVMALLLMFVWFALALLFGWRFQFSLRSLLALVVVVALPCSWLAVEMKKAKQQAEEVAEIRKWSEVAINAATYIFQKEIYDYQVDERGRLLANRRPQAPAWLLRLLGDDFFAQVHEVIFCADQTTDADLEHLKRLDRLQVLTIVQTQITDAGLGNLKHLNQLQVLWIEAPQFTDAGLENVKGLSQLQVLHLDKTQLTDAGLEHLKGLKQLSDLSLKYTQVTDAGLEHLKGLKQLKTLYVWGIKVTDEGVAKLQQALPDCKIER